MKTRALRVAIVNWNTEALLARCLDSLFAESPDLELEVVVVDNGSEDGSVAMLRERFPQVRVIANDRNLGFTKATNQGLEGNEAPWLLMLNSDVELRDRALERCLEVFGENEELGMLGCRVEYPDGRFQPSAFREPSLLHLVLLCLWLPALFPRSPRFNRERYGQQDGDRPREVDCVMGGFLLLKQRDLDELGLLDEAYWMYGEEVDLSHRLRRAGRKVLYWPLATVGHVDGASAGRDPRTAAWAYEARWRGYLLFLAKWRGLPLAWIGNLCCLLVTPLRLIGWGISDLRRGRRDRLLRLRAVGFHLRALLWPPALRSSWAREAAAHDGEEQNG